MFKRLLKISCLSAPGKGQEKLAQWLENEPEIQGSSGFSISCALLREIDYFLRLLDEDTFKVRRFVLSHAWLGRLFSALVHACFISLLAAGVINADKPLEPLMIIDEMIFLDKPAFGPAGNGPGGLGNNGEIASPAPGEETAPAPSVPVQEAIKDPPKPKPATQSEQKPKAMPKPVNLDGQKSPKPSEPSQAQSGKPEQDANEGASAAGATAQGKGQDGPGVLGGTGKGGLGGAGGGGYDGEFGVGQGPRFAKSVAPRFPAQAKRLGKEGSVLLRLTIDEHGKLQSVEVLESSGRDFEEEALSAIKASSFHPANHQGRPVQSRARLNVKFKLT